VCRPRGAALASGPSGGGSTRQTAVLPRGEPGIVAPTTWSGKCVATVVRARDRHTTVPRPAACCRTRATKRAGRRGSGARLCRAVGPGRGRSRPRGAQQRAPTAGEKCRRWRCEWMPPPNSRFDNAAMTSPKAWISSIDAGRLWRCPHRFSARRHCDEDNCVRPDCAVGSGRHRGPCKRFRCGAVAPAAYFDRAVRIATHDQRDLRSRAVRAGRMSGTSTGAGPRMA
jgi:hypothetical protein